jgi:CheY-like chemotaxis protein
MALALRPESPSRVLVVEDNPLMLIALDAEESFRALGVASVDVAASSGQALALLDRTAPDFALLDFNLGGETSEPVARALERRGIPFAFASGYSEVEAMTARFARMVAILLKPYRKADLESLLRKLVPKRRRA